MNQQSPMLRLWELGAAQHGSLIRAILSAVAGVLCGMAPYFAAAQILSLIHIFSQIAQSPFPTINAPTSGPSSSTVNPSSVCLSLYP